MDFFGTPKLVIKKADVFTALHNKNIVVRYRFDEKYTLVKPLGLSLTLFVFYLVAIFYSRISLSFTQTSSSQVAKVKEL